MTERQYDKTQLREKSHGQNLHRDYTAHFFRWSFASRYIKPTANVLEIGCGQDKPLSKILLLGQFRGCDQYVGVDLNKIGDSHNKNTHFIGEFNFVERQPEVMTYVPDGYDNVVSMEVIEHMTKPLGMAFLAKIYDSLRPGGQAILSTPAYDGRRMAKNHIHEWYIDELRDALQQTGFVISRRFGTFMDVRHIGKALTNDPALDQAIPVVYRALCEYFDNDAVSNMFGPLYPDHARNNLWICTKPSRNSDS